MNKKEKAYELYNSGFSYGEISNELFISKSTAHGYVKELKLTRSKNLKNSLNASSDKGLSVFSKERTNEQKSSHTFTGNELVEKQFDEIEFTGKFLELIGKPSIPFSAIIWGLPKGGKSNLVIRLADYLFEYFGTVCYFASEEGISSTLKLKIIEIGGSKMLFSILKNKDEIRAFLKNTKFDFVFIDSINAAGIDHKFLEILKEESPKTSFIGIVQATKSGNFKGDQALTHNCDFVIKVVEGIAYYQGRFNQSGQLEIFKDPLYSKNPIDIHKDIKVKRVQKNRNEAKEDSENSNHISHEEIVDVKKPEAPIQFTYELKKPFEEMTTIEKSKAEIIQIILNKFKNNTFKKLF